MTLQGRSPLKDITRSVVVGAAMVPAALLASCSRHGDATPTMTPGDSGIGTPPIVPPFVLAPPPDVVRPRVPVGVGPSMPTRGFSGGRRRG